MRLFLLLRFAKAHTYCTLLKPTELPPPLRKEENEKSICEKREEEDFPFRLPLFLPNLTNHVCRSGGGRAAAARLSPSLFPPSSSSSVFPSVRPFLGPSPHPSLAFRPPPPPPPPHISNPLPLLRLFPLFLSRLRLVPSLFLLLERETGQQALQCFLVEGKREREEERKKKK